MTRVALLCSSFLCLISNAGMAQSIKADRVWLAPGKRTESNSGWYPKPIKVIAGRISTLDNRQLAILITGDEALSKFAAYRVVWIEPGTMSAKESAALKLYADGDFAGALGPLIDSLGERPPVWRQQWISMLAADAAKRSSRGQIALELVSQLDARPLAPYVLAWLPVAWDNRRLPATSVSAAREKIADKSPAVRLVAASWLLSSPNRNEATTALKQLATDTTRPAIAKLAEFVHWRTATPPQVAENAESWSQQLDALPIVLQTGPTEALAEKLAAAGLRREAKQLKLALELTPAIPFPVQP